VDLSVVIVNYNTEALTRSCIRSVVEFTSGLEYEIILVDNASPQGFDEEGFRVEFPSVKFIRSSKNLGFAGGNNLGIQQATGEYVLLLNSDTYLTDNALLRLFGFMKAHPKVGAASARLVYPDGRHQSVAQRFPSVKYNLIEFLRFQKFMSRRSSGKLLLGAFFDHNETVRADWVWGACFIFPKKILSQMPERRLDEGYFMYYEDMQWCMDIHRLGYEIYFVANAEVVHIMGGSSANKGDLMKQNGALFLERNYKPSKIRWIKKLDQWLRP
jgi:GT2 family glycosyltransferase